MKKILFVGESWVIHSTHIKGFDQFESSTYEEGGKWVIEALEAAGYEVRYLRGHEAPNGFPYSMEELRQYDAVFFSDIGANSFLLSDDVFVRGQIRVNRLDLVRDYVADGGAFCMIGGYLSFSGIQARAQYGRTAINDILPVEIMLTDDRVEGCQGFRPEITDSTHELVRDLPAEWPPFLGYNQAVLRPDCEAAATINGDPFIAARDYGKGRTAVFMSDCSPHWATMQFVEWKHYNQVWKNIADYITKTI